MRILRGFIGTVDQIYNENMRELCGISDLTELLMKDDTIWN